MKFGSQLSTLRHPDWKFYYLEYDNLKRLLKPTGKFNEDSEAAFIKEIEAELDKVASFCQIKANELSRHVLHCEDKIKSILASNSNDMSRFNAIEVEMGRITADVTELSKFIRLNYSGFVKILKKHDKHTSFMLKSLFMVRLQAKPFYKLSFDSLILRLSKLYDTVRNGGSRKDPSSASQIGTSFVRKTTKYWVHPDNVTEVKIHVLKHLPVSVFPSSKSGNEPDPAITSVYFDNDQFDLYQGRLLKSQGAQALRLRWYGNMDQTQIFVERKTHHEDWTGEHSVKERFAIKEKYVNAFLKGEYKIDHAIEKLRAAGTKSEKELDQMKQLSQEIQDSISKFGYKPMLRTFYNRTAFQLPGDARVRISLDTELTMIREDNYGHERSSNNWRRLDCGTIAPFTYLPDEDVCPFPYAVLEVKLQTQHGTEAPQWVQQLISSNLVEEVPKFSKFIHGCAILFDDRIEVLPFWLPQMDKDIRKPANQPLLGANTTNGSDEDVELNDKQKLVEQHPKKVQANEIEVVVEQPGSSSVSSSKKAGKQKKVKVLDSDNEDDETAPLISNGKSNQQKKKKGFGTSSSSAASSSSPTQFDLKSIIHRLLGPPEYMNSGIPAEMNNKRIILPVRVEPKVFFANERTFLSWLHFCIVLGGLALGLLNFGDTTAQISGILFTGVSMLFMLYALYLYQWRAHKIRIRDPNPYDDRIGPIVLVLTLFSAVVVNFYLKFRTGFSSPPHGGNHAFFSNSQQSPQTYFI